MFVVQKLCHRFSLPCENPSIERRKTPKIAPKPNSSDGLGRFRISGDKCRLIGLKSSNYVGGDDSLHSQTNRPEATGHIKQEVNYVKYQNEPQETVTLEIVRAAEITPRVVQWLWYPYIPFGKVTLLQGDPGDGKSKLMLAIAALLSRGKALPFTEDADADRKSVV